MSAPSISVKNGVFGDIVIHREQRITTEFKIIVIGFILIPIPLTSYLNIKNESPIEIPLNKKGALAGLIRVYLLLYPTIILSISFILGFNDFFDKWWSIATTSWLLSMLLFRFPILGDRKFRDQLLNYTKTILKPSELSQIQRKDLFDSYKQRMIDAHLPVYAKDWEYRSPESDSVGLVYLYFIYALEHDHSSEKAAIEELLRKMHRNNSDKLDGFGSPLLKDMKQTIKREKRRAKAQLKRFQQHDSSSNNQFRNRI